MKLSPIIKRVLMVVCGLVLAIQLIPLYPRTNPPVITRVPWDSPAMRALASASCFDCHSNETRWPWYSYVAPISWLIVSDATKAGNSSISLI